MKKCPFCKTILTIESWTYCDEDRCRLERDRIKHKQKNAKIKSISKRK
jgi:hypothetical protein